MPHLLRVKPEHANKFGGLFPFGPFNRIVYNSYGIYLDSGFLDLVLKGFYNFKTYTPAILDINKSFTPIVGLLTFKLKRIGAGLQCAYKEIEELKHFSVNGVRESKALNCDVKTNEIIMTDPRGEGTVCTVTYSPRDTFSYMYPGTNLNQQSAYMEAQAIITTNAETENSENANLFGSAREQCVDRNVIEKEYKDEDKIFCSGDIVSKKYCQKIFPPSLFSGKLKLYIQSIYGGNYVEYANEQGSLISTISIGSSLKDLANRKKAARISVLSRGTSILHTDSLGNYYLINTLSWSVNPIVPTFQGTLLKRYLRSLNLDDGVLKNAYEAYILTTCKPTKPCYISGPSMSTYGNSLDFGWKANWNGTMLAQVALKHTQNNLRNSTLLKCVVESSGIEQLYEDEIQRKKDNLILQAERLNPNYVQIPGIYPIYSSNAKVIFTETAPGIFNHCFDGDVEDGEWFYSILGHNPNIPGYDAIKEEVDAKNKILGGLPYSEEFFLSLPDYFSLNMQVEETHTWLEPIQTDKIFVWDNFSQDYEWKVGCNPRVAFDGSCPDTVFGTVPVYCWFGSDDSLKIVNYVNRPVDVRDNNIIPAEGLCGPGSDYSLTEIFNGGGVSGFEVNGVGLTSKYGSLFSKDEATITVTGGNWAPYWNGTCGPSPGCDGNSATPGSPPFHKLFTVWQKVQKGSGKSVITQTTGSFGHYSCLVIPMDDAEGVHIALLDVTTETGLKRTLNYNDSLTVAKQESGVSDSGWVKKTTINQVSPWLGCDGTVYVAYTWGSPITWIGAKNAGFFPGPFKPRVITARKWGPSGEDTPIVTSRLKPVGEPTEITEESHFSSKGFFKSCFIGKDNKIIIIKELEQELTISKPSISGVGYFYNFLEPISLFWPYAVTGNVFGSMQTVQNLKRIRHPLGVTQDPKIFPYKKGHYHPVGYI